MCVCIFLYQIRHDDKIKLNICNEAQEKDKVGWWVKAFMDEMCCVYLLCKSLLDCKRIKHYEMKYLMCHPAKNFIVYSFYKQIWLNGFSQDVCRLYVMVHACNFVNRVKTGQKHFFTDGFNIFIW
jgi:hypothetical protein